MSLEELSIITRLRKEIEEQCRINAMGAERELALGARISEQDREIYRLTHANHYWRHRYREQQAEIEAVKIELKEAKRKKK